MTAKRVVLLLESSFKFNEKNNANQEMYQGVPKRSLANTTRFASSNSISDSAAKSNSFDENSSKNVDDGSSSSTAAGGPPSPILGKAEVDDGSRKALKKSDKAYREKVNAKAGERVKKTLDTLTRIDWRGKFSANVARGEIQKLSFSFI